MTQHIDQKMNNVFMYDKALQNYMCKYTETIINLLDRHIAVKGFCMNLDSWMNLNGRQSWSVWVLL